MPGSGIRDSGSGFGEACLAEGGVNYGQAGESRAARNYRQLEAWKVAMELVTAVYKVTATFPDSEKYALTSQLRRAAVSVPSNIAEGNGRGSTVDYRKFLFNARGSLYEVETQLEIALKVGHVDVEQLRPLGTLCRRNGQLLAGLIRSLDDKIGRASSVCEETEDYFTSSDPGSRTPDPDQHEGTWLQ